ATSSRTPRVVDKRHPGVFYFVLTSRSSWYSSILELILLFERNSDVSTRRLPVSRPFRSGLRRSVWRLAGFRSDRRAIRLRGWYSAKLDLILRRGVNQYNRGRRIRYPQPQNHRSITKLRRPEH